MIAAWNVEIYTIAIDANNLGPFAVRVVSIRRMGEQPIKAKTARPFTVVLFLGFFLSAVLLGNSIWQPNGMSTVATVLFSLLSSLIGYCRKWALPKHKITTDNIPHSDVVIRYPNHSFLVVHCNIDVARELYFAPAEIDYLLKHSPAYRILSLMLMGGVICLANAKIQLQIDWAASYMTLGAAYWTVAALQAPLGYILL
ncbi:hypothetical protein EK21DRAFT_119256 [Setomelanomma holmii]|uniref:Uncharacterized protein n=1 Tax=Setomelanomma holmii TaxID=210430 RepID=A0A9P4GW50_9PLEO|nr:hypothetical protein EK21DRAFT_119256 [Setomelanomma holmii]